MDPAGRAIDHEELLAQMTWVTALARSLVRDPNLAQDVAQQTWLTALERPPHTARSGPGLRAWLAAVTRSTARGAFRGEGRRSAREQRAARPEAEPSTADVVERGEMQRKLVDQVLELDEPYRTTVLLRYLDGLSGPEIAERMEVSPAAVRKRLSRGLEQLRGRLDTEHDQNRGAWIAALLPLARLAPSGAELGGGTLAGSELAAGSSASGGVSSGGASVGGTTTSGASLGGGTALGGKLGLGVAALVLVSICVVIWPSASETPTIAEPLDTALAGRTLPTLPTVPERASAEPEPLQPSADAELRRVAADAASESWTWPPFTGQLHGQVVDLDGRAVPDVRMRFEPVARPGDNLAGRATLTTLADTSGRFVLEGLRGHGRVFVASSRHVTVFPGNTDTSGIGGGQTIVVAPRQQLAGRVLDEAGAPIAEARVSIRLPEGLEGRFERSFEFASRFDCSTTTDADGNYALPRIPSVTGAQLEAWHEGYELHQQPLPDAETATLIVGLRRPEQHIAGRVVDRAGRPVAGADVSCGPRVTRSDALGQFAFHFTDADLSHVPEGPITLRAVRSGLQPAALELSVDPAAGKLALDGLLLTLGGPTLALAGRVVDPRGNPIEGAAVWIADPTVFGVNPAYPRSRGTPGEQEDYQTGARAGLPDLLLVVESVAAGEPEEMWKIVETDADGRFALNGLGDREYVVAAMIRSTLLRADSAPVRAGREDLQLVLDAADVYTSVSGRVVTRYGAPLEGVLVSLRGEGLRLAGNHSMHERSRVLSAADGSFTLADVPRDRVTLWFSGSDILATGLGDGGPLGARNGERLTGLEVVVPVRLQLQLTLDDPAEADAVRILDALGQPVTINTFQFDRRRLRAKVPVVDGRSEVLSVTDAAAVAELLRGGEPVRRIPLALLRGELNSIH